MVFTQGRGFVLGASFGLQIRSLRCRVLVCHAADTASLATRFLFGKLFGVTTLVDFGEKRCRKNLPLHDLAERDRMSLSLRRRDRDGNVHHYFIPFDPMVIIVLVAVSLGFAISAWFTFRGIVHESPLLVVSTIAIMLAIGFTSFAIAKLSVIRRGTLVSFGPNLMSSAMRRCYITGYSIMGCACLLAAFFTMAS